MILKGVKKFPLVRKERERESHKYLTNTSSTYSHSLSTTIPTDACDANHSALTDHGVIREVQLVTSLGPRQNIMECIYYVRTLTPYFSFLFEARDYKVSGLDRLVTKCKGCLHFHFDICFLG